jgi:hypothetical protein
MPAQRLKESSKNAVRACQQAVDCPRTLAVAVRAIDCHASACAVFDRPGVSLHASRFDR